jgi:hypothetical protein
MNDANREFELIRQPSAAASIVVGIHRVCCQNEPNHADNSARQAFNATLPLAADSNSWNLDETRSDWERPPTGNCLRVIETHTFRIFSFMRASKERTATYFQGFMQEPASQSLNTDPRRPIPESGQSRRCSPWIAPRGQAIRKKSCQRHDDGECDPFRP